MRINTKYKIKMRIIPNTAEAPRYCQTLRSVRQTATDRTAYRDGRAHGRACVHTYIHTPGHAQPYSLLTSTARDADYLFVGLRVWPERHRAQSCAIALRYAFTSQIDRYSLHHIRLHRHVTANETACVRLFRIDQPTNQDKQGLMTTHTHARLPASCVRPAN